MKTCHFDSKRGLIFGQMRPFNTGTELNKRALYLGFAVMVLITLISLRIPLFSDQVTLIGYPARLFSGLENTLPSTMAPGIIPEAADTGHPPLVAAYIALWWQWIGPSLEMAHWAQLPLLALLWFFYLHVAASLLPEKKHQWFALLILVAQPVWLAHAATVSVEMFLLPAFFAALFARLQQRPVLYVLALAFLPLVSLRGLVFWFAFFCWHGHQVGLSRHWKQLPQYAVSLLPFLLWNLWHCQQTGWVISHPDSPWIEHRQAATGVGLWVSAGAFVLRLLEFGALFIWLPLYSYIRQKENQSLAVFFVWMLFSLALATIPFANPIINRYLLPVYLVGGLMALPAILRFKNAMLYLTLWILAGVSSHFYVYPDRWAKRVGYAHDATLAYTSYTNQLRPDLHQFLDEHIPNDTTILIYSGFPEYHPLNWSDPNATQVTYSQQIDTVNWNLCSYIIISNIMNEIPYFTAQRIRRECTLMYRRKSGSIYIEVYRNPNQVKNG